MLNIFPTNTEMPSIRKTVSNTGSLQNVLAGNKFSYLLDSKLTNHSEGIEPKETKNSPTSEEWKQNLITMLEEGKLTVAEMLESLEILSGENGLEQNRFFILGNELNAADLQDLLQYVTSEDNNLAILDGQEDILSSLADAEESIKAGQTSSTEEIVNQQSLAMLQEIKVLMDKITMNNGTYKDMKQLLSMLKEWSSMNHSSVQAFLEASNMDPAKSKLWLQLVENFQRREALQTQYPKPITVSDLEKWIRHAMQNQELTGVQVERQDVSSTLTQTSQPKLAQYVIHMQQTEGNSLERQLVNELRQILIDSKFLSLRNGMNQLSIRLNPEHLGEMVVRLTEVNGEMTVRMIVQSQAAKELLDRNMHQLKHLFSPHQVAVEKQDSLFSTNLEKFQDEANEDTQKDDQQHEEQLAQDREAEEEEGLSFEEVLMDQKV
ncbi:flagellar hook-length control protein FliK [Gracilibacillus halotolerans]|uniref:Flagellar hook-length control protein FliK n=1 Tax=Gracilibacillus halotolerans TaxID=74386 RepID=A0A841RHC7_9BACI|nr:flagellar hook-length control protein FliK [Gracilibacillus halotolerans]MBB6511442.1 flagellar hook-length control protein FliK [Gracilibacillus halotolerans]